MSLDLTRVAAQVSGMIAKLKDTREERQKRLQFALDTLSSRSVDLDDLKRKIAASKIISLKGSLNDPVRHPGPGGLNGWLPFADRQVCGSFA